MGAADDPQLPSSQFAAVKLALGLLLMAATIAAALSVRSATVVPLFAVVFAVAYVLERRAQWAAFYEQRGWIGLVSSALATYAVQCLIVSLLLALPWGISALLGMRWSWWAGGAELLPAACLLLYAAATGLLLPARSLPDLSAVEGRLQELQDQVESLQRDLDDDDDDDEQRNDP